jgi:hypothetical protein
MIKNIYNKVVGLYNLITALMEKLGVLKTSIALAIAWAIYILVGRALIDSSACVLVFIVETVTNILSYTLTALPYLVGAALLALTVIFVLSSLSSKKEV